MLSAAQVAPAAHATVISGPRPTPTDQATVISTPQMAPASQATVISTPQMAPASQATIISTPMAPAAPMSARPAATLPALGADWAVVGWWVLANVLGWGVGLAVAAAIMLGFNFAAYPLNHAFVGAFTGIAVGLAQWFSLRRSLPVPVWWVLASIVGISIGAGAATAVSDAAGSTNLMAYGLFGLVVGVMIGLAQWAVLRTHAPQAGWWLLANAASVALGFLLGGIINHPIISWIPVGILYLAATGATMVWLVQGYQSDDVMAHAMGDSPARM